MNSDFGILTQFGSGQPFTMTEFPTAISKVVDDSDTPVKRTTLLPSLVVSALAIARKRSEKSNFGVARRDWKLEVFHQRGFAII